MTSITIIGIALLMALVDLSPALGTFLAGVVLADSEFRHELESDIEPFKGLLLVVALSMLLTPALFILYDKLVLSRNTESRSQDADHIDETGLVIIAGNGRFGQIVNRLLLASGVKTVVLDHEAGIIEMLSKFGVKSYYGDATRPELLEAAGIASATAIVIAIDDRERAVEMVEHVRRHYPHVKTLARAYDVRHLYLLRKAGADIAVREMFDGSLEAGKATLKAIGMHPFKAEKLSQVFRRHDHTGVDKLYELCMLRRALPGTM